MHLREFPKEAFTLLELIVVVIILAVLTGLAVPNFLKTVTQAQLRDMMQQLTALHAANLIYLAQEGDEYLNSSSCLGPPAGTCNVNEINDNLNINLIQANGVTYSYTRIATRTYTATGAYKGYTVTLTQAPISTSSPFNPSCTGGPACP